MFRLYVVQVVAKHAFSVECSLVGVETCNFIVNATECVFKMCLVFLSKRGYYLTKT